MPSARNMPVDSTKIITTTRHIDRIGANSNVGMRVTVAVVVQRRDQALRHFHVVFQFGTLARQNAVFDQLCLLITQLAIEGNHQRTDDGDGQYQRQNPERDDFVFELHLDSCPREGSGSYAKQAPCRR